MRNPPGTCIYYSTLAHCERGLNAPHACRWKCCEYVPERTEDIMYGLNSREEDEQHSSEPQN